MSGHSKWAGIKHKKAALDAQRGKIFSKINRELTVAVRQSGGNPETNPRLRLAMLRAREANMPADNIERAIKKGTGELPGVNYEAVTYEGYGTEGVAIMVEVLTDNKNRTTSDIRNIFAKRGGNLAGQGSVSWLFHKKGFFLVDAETGDEDKIMTTVLEAGAEDMRREGNTYEVVTSVKDFEPVKKALQEAGIKMESATLTLLPASTVKITDEGKAGQLIALVEALEDNDDVQNVYANFDIPEEVLRKKG